MVLEQVRNRPLLPARTKQPPMQQDQDLDTRDRQLANLLGWVSLALGLAALVMPREVARVIGASGDADSRAILRVVGVREIGAGIGILRHRKPAGWVWGRVAGDAMDLSLLSAAQPTNPVNHGKLSVATLVVLGITLVDLYTALRLSRDTLAEIPRAVQPQDIHVKKSITINKPIEQVYSFWHNFENLPRFMSHLESVQVMEARRSHWKAKAPIGLSVEWDAEMTQDMPNELIAWRSLEGATIPNWGTVRFMPAPGNRGTEVHVELHYESPAGKLGATVAKLLGEEPQIQVLDDLRAFKQVMETGEVVRAEGGETGKRLSMRPAQPLPSKMG